MNGYVAFYNGKRIEVHAATLLQARDKAALIFKTKQSWKIACVLAEKNGEQVAHSPAGL